MRDMYVLLILIIVVKARDYLFLINAFFVSPSIAAQIAKNIPPGLISVNPDGK